MVASSLDVQGGKSHSNREDKECNDEGECIVLEGIKE
jgi:hypothetical protein